MQFLRCIEGVCIYIYIYICELPVLQSATCKRLEVKLLGHWQLLNAFRLGAYQGRYEKAGQIPLFGEAKLICCLHQIKAVDWMSPFGRFICCMKCSEHAKVWHHKPVTDLIARSRSKGPYGIYLTP